MSSTRYEHSLRIEPQRSRILEWFLMINFSGTVLILFIVFPLLLALLLTAFLCGYLYRLYNHHVLRDTPSSVRLLVRETTGEWILHTLDGAERVVTLSPSSYIHPQLIILILQAEEETFTLPLLRDAIPADGFRALCVRLKVAQGEEKTA